MKTYSFFYDSDSDSIGMAVTMMPDQPAWGHSRFLLAKRKSYWIGSMKEYHSNNYALVGRSKHQFTDIDEAIDWYNDHEDHPPSATITDKQEIINWVALLVLGE